MNVDVIRHLESRVRAAPDRVAVLAEHPDGLGLEGRTWRTLDERARALAGVLGGRGLGRGARVAVYLHDSPTLVEACYGVLKSGAQLVGLSSRVAGRGLVQRLSGAGANAVIYQGALALRIWEVRACLAPPGLLVQMDDGTELPLADALDYEQALRRQTLADPPASAAGWTFEPAPEIPLPLTLVAGPLLEEEGLVAGILRSLPDGHALLVASGHAFDPHRVWSLTERHPVDELVVTGERYLAALLEALDEAAGAGEPYRPDSLRRIVTTHDPDTAVRARLQAKLEVPIAAAGTAG